MEKRTEWHETLKILFSFLFLAFIWIGIPVLIIMSMVAFPVFWVILLLLLLVLK